MSTRTRLLAPLVGAVLLLGVAVTPAAALTKISATYCATYSEGVAYIAPDFVYLTGGWGAVTKGQLLSNLKALTLNVTVDGTPWNVTPFMTDPYQSGGAWWVIFEFPLGEFTSGETMTVSVEYVLSRPIYDGVEHIPAGSLGTSECTIIAT